MVHFSQFTDWFRRRRNFPGDLPPDSPVLQNILDAQARRLREVDPDTTRQWQFLNLVLRRGSSPERKRSVPGAFRLLNPAVSFGGIAVIAVIVAGVIWMNRSSLLTYVTGRGEQSSIILPDSSQVALNHTSTLVVESRPFDDTRHVSLTGEAYFHARKNGSPFVVSTDVGTVQVLGTEFDVRIRGGQLVVGVLSGSVKVTARRDGRDSSVVLMAGQITTCMADKYPASPGQLPFADYPGWTKGKLLFYKTSVSAVCEEIESQFDVQVILENPHTGIETITGAIDGRSAAIALAALSNLTGNKLRHENNRFTLY